MVNNDKTLFEDIWRNSAAFSEIVFWSNVDRYSKSVTIDGVEHFCSNKNHR